MTDTVKSYPHPRSFRLDEATDTLLLELKEKFGVSQADVVRLAIRKLHEMEVKQKAKLVAAPKAAAVVVTE